MKICLVTTDEETIFIPKGINYLVEKFNNEIQVVCVPGFSSFKRKFYFFFLLYFKEFFEILIIKIYHFFKKKIINCSYQKIENINSKDFLDFIKKHKFNLIISYSCPQIFNKNTLKNINELGINIANFHPGILPKYRGLFTNYYSLKNNEKNIGITFHKINSQIDSGNILSELKIPIEQSDTIYSLYKKIYLSENSFKFIRECLMNYDKIKDNKYKFNEKSKYNSYPNFSEIIRYRFKKF